MITLTVYKHKRKRKHPDSRVKKTLLLLLIPIIILSVILIYKVKFFTIIDGGERQTIITFANTYFEELSNKKINLNNQDKTSIDVNSKISNGSVLTINRFCTLEIIYEGRSISVDTTATSLLDVLKENDLPIRTTQVYNIDLKSKPENNMKLVIDNIEVKQISKDEKVVDPNNSNISNQTKQVVYEQTYKNGILMDEKKLDEKIIASNKKFELVTPDKDPDSIYVLVNKDYKLKKNFIPKDLVIPDIVFADTCSSSENQLTEVTANALKDMFAAAKQENMNLYMLSGYRSYETQSLIYSPNDSYTNEPGASEHQTGLVVDIINTTVNDNLLEGSNLSSQADLFLNSKEGQWLIDNSWEFGFILRYPKDKVHITGISFESWHFRYVGKEFAEELYNLDETLEEYNKR